MCRCTSSVRVSSAAAPRCFSSSSRAVARVLLAQFRFTMRVDVSHSRRNLMAGFCSLDELLEEELKDLYDAEKQLTKALQETATVSSGRRGARASARGSRNQGADRKRAGRRVGREGG